MDGVLNRRRTVDQRSRDAHIPVLALAALALLLAPYRRFRKLGDWVATLEAVSVTDGFHRRFLVGTLLHPIAVATGYAYGVFAAAAFAVLDEQQTWHWSSPGRSPGEN